MSTPLGAWRECMVCGRMWRHGDDRTCGCPSHAPICGLPAEQAGDLMSKYAEYELLCREAGVGPTLDGYDTWEFVTARLRQDWRWWGAGFR